MVKYLSRETEKDGTRKLMMAGSGVAAVLFVGFIVWFAVPQMFGATDYLGRPSTGADKGAAATTVVGTGVPTQHEAVSKAAKENPAGNEDTTGGRARDIQKTSQPAALTDQQPEQV